MNILNWALVSYRINSYFKNVVSFLFCFEVYKERNDQMMKILTLRLGRWELLLGFSRATLSRSKKKGGI